MDNNYHNDDHSLGGFTPLEANATWIGGFVPSPSGGVWTTGGIVASGGTSLGPISTFTSDHPNYGAPPPAPPAPEIKAGERVVIKDSFPRASFLVLAEWAAVEGTADSLGPFLVLAQAEDKIPSAVDCGEADECPDGARIVPKSACRLVTDKDINEERTARAREERERQEKDAERDRRATERYVASEAEKRKRDAVAHVEAHNARLTAERKARSKHRARMRLLRRHGPTVGRFACGIAGTLFAILGLVLASR